MLPFGERIRPVSRPGFRLGIEPEEERGAVGADGLGVAPGLLVGGEEIRAVAEDDRPVADHHPLFEREHRRIRPRLGVVARDLELDPRGRPRLAVADDIEEPDEAVGSRPDHAVADRPERVVRDRFRGRPGEPAPLQPGTEDRGIPGVLPRAAVIDEIEVAVAQLGHARRMLVGSGGRFRSEDPPDGDIPGVGPGPGDQAEAQGHDDGRSHGRRPRRAGLLPSPLRRGVGPRHTKGIGPKSLPDLASVCHWLCQCTWLDPALAEPVAHGKPEESIEASGRGTLKEQARNHFLTWPLCATGSASVPGSIRHWQSQWHTENRRSRSGSYSRPFPRPCRQFLSKLRCLGYRNRIMIDAT